MKRLGLLLLLLAARTALAQQGTTSEITGRVVSGGQPLPGVVVTATSERLQGIRRTITGANGGFLIPLLPPGHYALRLELDGFTASRRSVAVTLGVTARVEVELQPEAVRETIDVEATSRALAGGATIGTAFGAEEVERLPLGRDLRSIVLLSPSASVGRALMIAGAPSWDSLFLVDGLIVNEYQTGQPQPVLFQDAIEEVVVLTGSIPAEYGRFTGGVVSTLTKSGGNEFHGSLRDRLVSGAWQTSTPWPGEPRPGDELHHALDGTLGGFVVRDRLWFFTAARDADRSVRRFTTSTNVRYASDIAERRLQGKLTAWLTPRHSLAGTFVTSSIDERNVTHPRTEGRVLSIDALIREREQPLRLLALSSASTLSPRWFAEAHYSMGTASFRGNGGDSRDRILGTTINVRGLGATMNAPFGCGICGDDRRDHDAWSAKASHYRNTRSGNHTLAFGASGFRERRRNRATRSSSEFTIQSGSARIVGEEAFPLFGAGTMIFWTPYYEGERGSDLGTTGIFLSDRWEINRRVTLSLGMRHDRNRARDVLGRVISNDGGTSPRLSLAVDLTGDGRHRFIAGHARYTAKLLEGGGSPVQVGVFNNLAWRYRGPEINSLSLPADQLLPTRQALQRLFEWFDSVGGVDNRDLLTLITSPASSGDFDGSLRSPAVDEWSMGYVLDISSGAVRVDLVARDWRSFYALQVDSTTGRRTDAFGNTVDVARTVNDDDGTVRTYRAAQIQFRWQRRHVRLGGGYTLSSLRGNDEGEEAVSAGAPRNLPLALWYPEFFAYPRRRPVGYLAQDQRHRVRAWVMWDGAVRRQLFNVALLQTFGSGTPYSAVGDIDATGRNAPFAGLPPNPGYTLSHATPTAYFFSDRGALRTDDVWSTDLSFGWELSKSIRPRITVDVFNLLNRAAVVSPAKEVLTRQTGGISSGLQPFNPFTETPVEGVHYIVTPMFGRPTGPESYQTPRRYEISVGLRF